MKFNFYVKVVIHKSDDNDRTVQENGMQFLFQAFQRLTSRIKSIRILKELTVTVTMIKFRKVQMRTTTIFKCKDNPCRVKSSYYSFFDAFLYNILMIYLFPMLVTVVC